MRSRECACYAAGGAARAMAKGKGKKGKQGKKGEGKPTAPKKVMIPPEGSADLHISAK